MGLVMSCSIYYWFNDFGDVKVKTGEDFMMSRPVARYVCKMDWALLHERWQLGEQALQTLCFFCRICGSAASSRPRFWQEKSTDHFRAAGQHQLGERCHHLGSEQPLQSATTVMRPSTASGHECLYRHSWMIAADEKDLWILLFACRSDPPRSCILRKILSSTWNPT